MEPEASLGCTHRETLFQNDPLTMDQGLWLSFIKVSHSATPGW